MQLRVKGKNLEVSDAIRDYAERKVAKVGRMLNDPAEVEVELRVEKNPSIASNQVAEATVWWMKGHTLRAEGASADMKAAIDQMTEVLQRQVKDELAKRETQRRATA